MDSEPLPDSIIIKKQNNLLGNPYSALWFP